MNRKPGERTDKELVAAFQGGDIEAYECIITRYQAKIYNMALRVTRDTHDAEEVVQDVCVTLFKKIQQFEGRCAFSSWIYRITMNTALMLLRKRKYRSTSSLDELQGSGVRDGYAENTTGNAFRDSEIRDQIEGALKRLPETYQKVFIIREVKGLSNEQASEVLKMSVPAVKSKLHRARSRLRKSLRHYWDDYTETSSDAFSMAA